MNTTIPFIRFFFLVLCILFFTAYLTTPVYGGFNYTNATFGITSGIAFGMFFIGLDVLLKRYNLLSFNTAILGLFLGYLMGLALVLILDAVISLRIMQLSAEAVSLAHLSIYLLSAYLGMCMTARASDEFYMSIPFVKFHSSSQKKKDILIDVNTLTDTKIVDLASSGLLDHSLIIPRSFLKEINYQSESTDETIKSKARRCQEIVKKLENIPNLDMRYTDLDFPEIKDSMTKLIKLARFLDANIFTSDLSKIQQALSEGVKFINVQIISQPMKPAAQAGEHINIRIQRLGKDPRQGVGYLDDGTMVVVNGGAEFLGDFIKAQVLSFNQTTSGRMMIFCNALTSNNFSLEQDMLEPESADQHAEKNYFSV